MQLLERVGQQHIVFFNAKDAGFEDAKPPTLRLTPSEQRLAELQEDYKSMEQMFFNSPPEFGEIMETIRNFESQVNQS